MKIMKKDPVLNLKRKNLTEIIIIQKKPGIRIELLRHLQKILEMEIQRKMGLAFKIPEITVTGNQMHL